MTFRLAVVADIHHGPDILTKCGGAALGLARDFVDWANAQGVDAVLDLGDRISDVDPGADAARAAEVAAVLGGLEMPRYHLDGNHDLDHLSRADNDRILGREPGHRVVRAGDWDLVLWQPDPRVRRSDPRALQLDPAALAWLDGVVASATRPLLVASHTPVSPMAMAGNYWFEHMPDCAVFPEAPEVRARLAAAGVPVVCLSGHVHWNSIAQENGIAYLTQQSLTESFTTQGRPAGAWGLIALGAGLDWQVRGADPFGLSLRPGAARWNVPRGRASAAAPARAGA